MSLASSGTMSEAHAASVHNHERIAAIRRIDDETADSLDFQARIQFVGKRGQVFYGNPLCLPVATPGPHVHETARRLQCEPCFGLLPSR